MIFWNWGTTKNWYNLASAQFLSLSEITPAYCRIVEQLSDHDIKKHATLLQNCRAALRSRYKKKCHLTAVLQSSSQITISKNMPPYCRIVEQLSDHDIKKHRADICLNGLHTGGLFLGCFLPQASLFENRLKFQKEILRIFEDF